MLGDQLFISITSTQLIVLLIGVGVLGFLHGFKGK